MTVSALGRAPIGFRSLSGGAPRVVVVVVVVVVVTVTVTVTVAVASSSLQRDFILYSSPNVRREFIQQLYRKQCRLLRGGKAVGAATMAKIVVLANQKGGVGKTTSAIHLAAATALKGYRTLLLDLDPQGNVASGLGIRKTDVSRGLYEVMTGNCPANDAIIPTKTAHLSLLPSTLSLVGVENELADVSGRNTRLKETLQPITSDYDYIFIDCPPSLSRLTVNALTAADGVVVPMTCDFYSLEGLSQLLISIKKIRSLYNPTLDFTGILLTMVQPRYTLTMQVIDELKRHYSEKLFKTHISRSVRLAEAPGFGDTVFVTAPESKSAKEYAAATKELLMRI